ncbi:hypothetical protein CGRA01v4_08203 [Colletotrichum graminicola]|nr:hypothetical protein CGRA01v4_08203 [Colletotrichum graminicola]
MALEQKTCGLICQFRNRRRLESGAGSLVDVCICVVYLQKRSASVCLMQHNGDWSVVTQLNPYFCYLLRVDLCQLHSAHAMMPVPAMCMPCKWSVIT